MNVQEIEEVPDMGDKKLENIFDLQIEILDHYIGLEGLPPYPMDIDTKENQVLLKDFSARIVEELGEAFDCYLEMWEVLNSRSFEECKYQLKELLFDFNEELSDALHFFMEILIFTNIGSDSIRKYVSLKTDVDYINKNCPIKGLLSIAKYHNLKEGININNIRTGVLITPDSEIHDEFVRGGRRLSAEVIPTMERLMWRITFPLQMARNTLKNKPWKQTEVVTDHSKYQNLTMGAFINLFKLFDFMGMTSESIYYIYFKKNLINKHRIQNKY